MVQARIPHLQSTGSERPTLERALQGRRLRAQPEPMPIQPFSCVAEADRRPTAMSRAGGRFKLQHQHGTWQVGKRGSCCRNSCSSGGAGAFLILSTCDYMRFDMPAVRFNFPMIHSFRARGATAMIAMTYHLSETPYGLRLHSVAASCSAVRAAKRLGIRPPRIIKIIG